MWFRRRLKLSGPNGATADGAGTDFVRYLEGILPTTAATAAIRARLRRLKALPPAERDKGLPALYLLIERAVAGAGDDAAQARAALRRTVAKRFAPLLRLPDFALILAPVRRQEVLLCRRLIAGVIEHALALPETADDDFLRALATWIEAVPDAAPPPPFDFGYVPPTRDSEWVALFFRLARELYQDLKTKLGEASARSFFERSYNGVSAQYASLETFPVVVNLLPETLLDSEKIGKLSRSQIQKVLLRKVAELNDFNGQLRLQYDEIDRVRRELVAARDELERRVAERTAELRAANRQLLNEIAERQKAEEELRAAKDAADIANRAKSEFLANMSHELRTPLNAIIGFADIMRKGIRGPLSNPDYQAYVEDIHASGEHLLSIINEILDMAKVEAGKIELHETETDVSAALEAAIRLVRPRAEESGIEIRVADTPDLPLLYADDRLLRQIFLNLLSNAVKFTSAGGTATVEIEVEASGGLAVRIRDTGIGIAPEDLPKALAPFGQVDSALSRKQGGTGLGLPLAKCFTELHGGELALESEIGVGTTATVRFPASRVLRPGEVDPRQNQGQNRGNIVAFAKTAPR